MKVLNPSCRARQQNGFTLFELLIALILVLMVLVAAQRYVAGVVVDHEGITERRDHATQTRIVLSNIQRDIAQSGFFPFASSDVDVKNAKAAGVSLINNTLVVSSYQPIDSARDCNGRHAKYDPKNNKEESMVNQALQSQGWVYVENIYSIVEGSLACNGNGDKDADRLKVLDGVRDMQVTIQSNKQASPDHQMVHLCLVTQSLGYAMGGAPTRTLCNGNALANSTNNLYYKTQIDMPIYMSSFQAGQ